MKKKQINFISNGLDDYAEEEADRRKMPEALKLCRVKDAWEGADVKAEEQAAWEEYAASFFAQEEESYANVLAEEEELKFQNLMEEEADLEKNWSSIQKEIQRNLRLAAAKEKRKNRRRNAYKTKQYYVKLAENACRSLEKRGKHDCHGGYGKAYSLKKSIRGYDGNHKSRTRKASRLVKRAEKVTGGQFDWHKFV